MRLRPIVALVYSVAAAMSAAIMFATPVELAVKNPPSLIPVAAAVAALLAWFTFTRFAWPRDLEPSTGRRRALLALALSAAPASLLLMYSTPTVIPLHWSGRSSAGASKELVRFNAVSQWGALRSGFEVHAAASGDSLNVWRATSDLPLLFRYLGSEVRLFVTEPEWVVVDSLGAVRPGADGVRIDFVASGASKRTLIDSLSLNPHARADERRWHAVTLVLPTGTLQAAIEVTPGPPGSNNWHDRVWVSEPEAVVRLSAVAAVAKGLTISLALWLCILVVFAALSFPVEGSDSTGPRP